MNMQRLVSLAHAHRRLVSLIIGMATLSVAAVAIAAITSGSYETASSTQVTTTNVTVNKPSSSTGDVLLATIAIHGGSSANVRSVPSGWHLIASTTNDAALTLLSYWKADSGSEPSSYTWSVAGQTTGEGAITAYSGVSTTTPIDVYAGNTGLSATATTSAVTTRVGIVSSKSSSISGGNKARNWAAQIIALEDANGTGDQLVALFAVDEGKTNNAGSYFSTANGMTEKFDVSNTPFGPSISLQEAAQIPITFDNADSTTFFGTSGILSFTTSGNDRMLVVSVAEAAPTGITYNGVSMTKATSTVATSVWYLINPASGTHDISVTIGSTQGFSVHALSLNGVDQTTGVGALATANEGSLTSSGSLSLTTTAANSWIVDALFVNDQGTSRNPSATGSNQTLRSSEFIPYVSTYADGAQSTITTTSTGSYTSSYSWTGSDGWTISAVEILPAN
jgi:hypothetical protein